MKKERCTGTTPWVAYTGVPRLGESATDQFLGQIIMYVITVNQCIIFSVFECAY